MEVATFVRNLCNANANCISLLRLQLAFGYTGLHSWSVIMKIRLLIIPAVGLLLAACNRQASQPSAPKTDLDRFQGTWYLVLAMKDGKPLPEDQVKQTTIMFKGDQFRFP